MEKKLSPSERRVIGPTAAIAIVISNMIGTGIFTTTGLILQLGLTPGDVLLAWLIGGVLSTIGALIYGELGMAFPYSGGEYIYLSRILHPAIGFLSGWVSLIAGFAAPVAAAAMAMHLYLARIFPSWPVRFGASLTVVVLAYLHTRNIRWGSLTQTLLTSIKVLLLLGFIVIIFRFSHRQPFFTLLHVQPHHWFKSEFAVAVVFVSFAYSGWNAAAYIGEEIRNPRKYLPLSLLTGTLIVLTLYALTNLAYFTAAPVERLTGKPEIAHEAALAVWGPAGANFVSFLIATGLVATVSAMVMVGPRVLEAMARDGFIPPFFARLNRYQTPAPAILLQTGLSLLMILTAAFGPLLIYIGYTLNIFTALTAVALIVHRRRRPTAPRIFVGYPILPLLFIAFALWMTVWSVRSQPLSTLAGLATLFVGYFSYLYFRPRTQHHTSGNDNRKR